MPARSPSDESRDHVDDIVDQWARERPDIDVSAMAIIGRLARIDKIVRSRIDAVFAQHDLESWEFDVLATLVRNGAPHQLTPGQLLDSMMVTSGAMTNRIDRLEQRGFVRRERSATDGRQVLVTLTEKGRTRLDATLVDHAANELDIVGLLTPAERAQLIHLLRTFHRALTVTTDADHRPEITSRPR